MTKKVKYRPDGSLEIYIQHDLPMKDKNSNWLPAPMGDFLLFFRAYMSRKELLDGQWKIPPVMRVE